VSRATSRATLNGRESRTLNVVVVASGGRTFICTNTPQLRFEPVKNMFHKTGRAAGAGRADSMPSAKSDQARGMRAWRSITAESFKSFLAVTQSQTVDTQSLYHSSRVHIRDSARVCTGTTAYSRRFLSYT
jgi:hypothetical protein